MRAKAVSMFLLLLGALVLAQAIQQANSYWTSGPQVKAGIWAVEQQYKLAEDQAKLIGQTMTPPAELEETRRMLQESQSIYLQTAVVDALVGVILVFLGILYHPDEKRDRSVY